MKDSGSTDDLASGNESGTEEKTSDHKVRPVKKMAPKFFKTKNSSSNPKKLGRRLGCNIQETLNIDNNRESDASVKSKHCRKTKKSFQTRS